MALGCSDAVIYDALRIGLFVFVLHAFCFQLWWQRLGHRLFWGDLFSALPAISVAYHSFEGDCLIGVPRDTTFFVVLGLPFVGAFILSFVLDKHGFPDWRRGFPGFLFAAVFMVPYLGAVYALSWVLLSRGLPNLLFLPPARAADRSWCERIIRYFFLSLLAAFVIAVVWAMIKGSD